MPQQQASRPASSASKTPKSPAPPPRRVRADLVKHWGPLLEARDVRPLADTLAGQGGTWLQPDVVFRLPERDKQFLLACYARVLTSRRRR
jgi:hypothetical protein